MRKHISIIFYRLYKHYDDFYQATIITTGIFLFNLFSIYLFLVTMGVFQFTKEYTKDNSVDRFISGPIIILMLCLPLYFYLKKNNHYLTIINQMEVLDEKNIRKNNSYFWIYIIGSVFIFLLAILSGFLFDVIMGKIN